MAEYVLWGAQGYGSVIVEGALTLLGLPYRREEIDAENLADWDRLARVNPLRQVPALITPEGELMTESGAILTWLADRHPQAGLAPAIDDPRRGQFLRWMTFIPASIYSMYWVRDDPSRLSADPAAQEEIKEKAKERIADCWRMMDAQVSPGRYILGDDFSVLDLYVTIVSRWSPRRVRFYELAPKMAEVVRRVDADPRLAAFWAERFPFYDGWEG